MFEVKSYCFWFETTIYPEENIVYRWYISHDLEQRDCSVIGGRGVKMRTQEEVNRARGGAQRCLVNTSYQYACARPILGCIRRNILELVHTQQC